MAKNIDVGWVFDTHREARPVLFSEGGSFTVAQFRSFMFEHAYGLEAMFDVTPHQWDAATAPDDESLARTGRAIEMLSEHQCQGWIERHLLTGRHGVFNCYEAFVHIVDSMFLQHPKWLQVAAQSPLRTPALGPQEPLAAKQRMEPDDTGRKVMTARIGKLIPRSAVGLCGTTSIDVTWQGIDQASGVGKRRDIHGIAIDKMLFVGEALPPGSDNGPVEQAGVRSIQIRVPDATRLVVRTILACCDATAAPVSANRG